MSKHILCRGAFCIAIGASILVFTFCASVNGEDKFNEYDARLGPLSTRTLRKEKSWFLADVEGDQIVMRSGGDDGFGTHLAFSPARKAGVVMMFNSDEISSIKKIWQAALGTSPPF
jgi:hypothetical protein